MQATQRVCVACGAFAWRGFCAWAARACFVLKSTCRFVAGKRLTAGAVSRASDPMGNDAVSRMAEMQPQRRKRTAGDVCRLNAGLCGKDDRRLDANARIWCE